MSLSCPEIEMLEIYVGGSPRLRVLCHLMFWGVRSSSRGEGWLCLLDYSFDGYGLSMKVPMTTACLKDCSFGWKSRHAKSEYRPEPRTYILEERSDA